MLNKVIIMGRLTRDPEFRQTTSGIPVCRFSVAVDRPYRKEQQQQEADFISCTAWRNTAEFVSRYFSKCTMIVLEGCLRNNNYTDQNGVKHYSMDVLVDNVQFGESKKQQDGRQQDYGAAPQQNGSGNQIGDIGEFEEILSDGEVPF